MAEDWVYVTTTVLSEGDSRPSMVLRANGEPFYLEKRKEPIGFKLKPVK